MKRVPSATNTAPLLPTATTTRWRSSNCGRKLSYRHICGVAICESCLETQKFSPVWCMTRLQHSCKECVHFIKFAYKRIHPFQFTLPITWRTLEAAFLSSYLPQTWTNVSILCFLTAWLHLAQGAIQRATVSAYVRNTCFLVCSRGLQQLHWKYLKRNYHACGKC